jgi:hypothetical protein
MVSVSSRRILGANFMINCARSVSSSRGILKEGSVELSCADNLLVKLDTRSELACNSCTKHNAV